MRGRIRRVEGVLALALILTLILAAPAVLPRVSAAPPAFVPRSLGLGPAAPKTSAFYLQEGATVAAVNGSSSTRPSVLRANLTVPSSPYATGYEMNGLSDSGDWYQLLVADNWPGCPSGLVFAYEIWNAAGATAAPSCTLGVVVSAGDVVTLTLELNCASSGAGSYCMTFDDVTAGQNATASGTQPDAGGTGFVSQVVPADANGYFTGPMTEVVDASASTCLPYTSLPTVDYVLGNRSVAPTSYLPWSDEFQVTNTGATACYVNTGVVVYVAGSPLTAYAEASGGSPYGPHWVAGQDWSSVPGTAGGWRFQTDVVPLSATISLSRTTADVGQSVTVTLVPSGGMPPYTCDWTVGGSTVNGTACTTSVTIPNAGPNALEAFVIDADSDYLGASATVNATARPSLALAASASSILLGRSLTLTPTITGGLAPYTVTWTGLPPGCAAPSGAANVTCTPSAAGTYLVVVSATDANEVTAQGVILVTVDAGILGAPTPVATVLIAVVVVSVVLLFILLARPRRRRPTRMPPTDGTAALPPPPPPAAPPPPPP